MVGPATDNSGGAATPGVPPCPPPASPGAAAGDAAAPGEMGRHRGVDPDQTPSPAEATRARRPSEPRARFDSVLEAMPRGFGPGVD